MKAKRARTLLKQISFDNVIRKSFGIDKNSVQSKAIPGNVVADGSTAPWKTREGWKILDDLPSPDAFGSTAPTTIQGVEAHTDTCAYLKGAMAAAMEEVQDQDTMAADREEVPKPKPARGSKSNDTTKGACAFGM